MRLQRALAQAGVASRRAAELLIEEGRVRVDGKIATLGMKVDPETQSITVGGKKIKAQARRWMAFHKPLGIVTTASDEEGRPTVYDILPQAKGLTYVGRLDMNTTGLLLLTTDGDAVHRLTHPRYRVPRSYIALVHGRSTADIAQAVTGKVVVEGRPVLPTRVKVKPGKDGRSIVELTLIEGRNHVVRKWATELGLKVDRLARLTYGPVRLGDLAAGEGRLLTPAEIQSIYRLVRLDAVED